MSSFFIQMVIGEIEMPANDRTIGFTQFNFFSYCLSYWNWKDLKRFLESSDHS